MNSMIGNPPGQDDFFSVSSELDANEKLSICELGPGDVVRRQNIACRTLCGKRVGSRCTDGCRKILLGASEQQLISRENVILHGREANLIELRTSHSKLVFAELHQNAYRDAFSRLASLGLTPAEQRVARMKYSGFSIRDIAGALFVSPSTIKTHLLHAYQKLPSSVVTKIQRGLRKK